MDELVTTCVQQQIRVFESHGEFRSDVQRFMRLAKIKESHLVVFPELCGLMLAPPLVPGLKRTLLRVAERQIKRKPSLFERMIGRAASSAAEALGGISGNLLDAFTAHGDTLRDAYLTIFSEVAREYNMYIIGGSIYLPDPRDGQMRNTAYLFSPTGEVIGQQAKVCLRPTDKAFCKPAARGLEAFETDFGKIGILIGQDVLFPESGRLLAGLGANFLVHVTAAPSQMHFVQLRNALMARLQENLFLGAQSCLVGKNILSHKDDQKNDYMGKSALLAPMEMTARHSGVLGEVGTLITEGIISAAWDLKGLYELHDTTDMPALLTTLNDTLRRQVQALYGEPGERVPILPPPTLVEMPAEAREEPQAPEAETIPTTAGPVELEAPPAAPPEEEPGEPEVDVAYRSLFATDWAREMIIPAEPELKGEETELAAPAPEPAPEEAPEAAIVPAEPSPSAVEEAALVVEEAAPVAEEAAPFVEEAAPVTEELTPVTEATEEAVPMGVEEAEPPAGAEAEPLEPGCPAESVQWPELEQLAAPAETTEEPWPPHESEAAEPPLLPLGEEPAPAETATEAAEPETQTTPFWKKWGRKEEEPPAEAPVSPAADELPAAAEPSDQDEADEPPDHASPTTGPDPADESLHRRRFPWWQR